MTEGSCHQTILIRSSSSGNRHHHHRVFKVCLWYLSQVFYLGASVLLTIVEQAKYGSLVTIYYDCVPFVLSIRRLELYLSVCK